MMKGLILVSFALVTMANAICPCADSTRPSCKDESKPRPVPTCKDGNRPVCSNDKPPAKPTCNGIALSESLVCQDGSPLNTTSFPPCTEWKKPKCKDGSKVLCEDGSRPGRPRFGRPLCPCEDGNRPSCKDGSKPRPVPTCKDGNSPVCSDSNAPPAKPTCNGTALAESLVCQDGSPLNTSTFPPCADWKKPTCKDGVSKVLCADGSRPGRRQPWTRPGFGRPGIGRPGFGRPGIFGGFGRPGVFGGRPGPFGKYTNVFS